ncbi:PAS domain-containing protein [Sneathiella sp. P13V-1]|uniref:PAS domain-containing sensor histidine kinase n=1 Tax=Sneathiella sp. P13V-1 TaxID=2697366 RepID=UPI00187BA0E3|nr:PAS domain-containing sensor histidine kinase [Sneathiella sp. P13V-1]MBE7637745.1 PAS domain-containing protein [Sneathiella sp. P13V-1]
MSDTPKLAHFKGPEALAAFNHLHTVIWAFNIDDHKFWWANDAALKFWEKRSLEEFLSVDLSSDSPIVRRRLLDVFESASSGRTIEENWTLYPGGIPKMVVVTFTAIWIEDHKKAVLIEASPQLKEELDPRAKRMLEAARHTPLLISSFDMHGKLLAQNPAAASLYGATTDDEVSLESRYGQTNIVPHMLQQTSEKQSFHADVKIDTSKGERWHTITAEPGRDPVTGHQVFVVTEEDVTDKILAQQELKQLNLTLEQRVAERTEKLSQAIQEAVNANKAKTDFLAMMSHELRTPLNAIIGFSEMMSYQVYGPITEKQEITLRDINKSGRHLLEQINDLLDASTIDRGELNLFESDFLLKPALEYCVKAFELEADKKQQTLELQVPEFPITLNADEHRITQILMNLISNAIKYTPEEGNITVSSGLNDKGELYLSVTDNGIGISADRLQFVTQAFVQIDISSSFTSGKGVGLGLYITSQLLAAHGGRLEIESKEGVGTTMCAILPKERTKLGC